MANTYTWTVDNMASQVQLDSYNDVVVEVAWNCTGTDGTYYSTVPGLTRITFTGGGDFTPYSQLTQDQVLGWVWDSGVSQADTEATVDQLIELQINPPIVTLPLPWIS